MGSLSSRRKVLETIRQSREQGQGQMTDSFACPQCQETLDRSAYLEAFRVCPHCGDHGHMSGQERIQMLLDADYQFLDFGSQIDNPIDFPGYEEKRQDLEEKSGLKEAITMAEGRLNGYDVLIAVLELSYLYGTLGSYVGNELASLFEYGQKARKPIVVFSASGGARMQEGIFSLMQMAKTAEAIAAFDRSGLLYISVLTNPTTGGVSASFASLGDIMLAEPEALICFAGPRVIQQTIQQDLPEGFQRAEKLLECGFIDQIVARSDQKDCLTRLLKLHQRKEVEDESSL